MELEAGGSIVGHLQLPASVQTALPGGQPALVDEEPTPSTAWCPPAGAVHTCAERPVTPSSEAVDIAERASGDAAVSATLPSSSGAPISTAMRLPCGARCYVEEHLVLGVPGYYKRARVMCPLATSTHKDSIMSKRQCQKYHNMMDGQTKRLGINEPLAFLGAWIALAPQCDDKVSHVHRTPKAAEVNAYFAEHFANT
jgi:hypothetical protein